MKPLPDKESLRRRFRSIRESLSHGDIRRKSAAIKEKLFALPQFRAAKTVCFYVSFDHEVYTHDMVLAAKSQGKRVVIPRVDDDSNELRLCLFQSLDKLSPSRFAVPEPPPETHEPVSVEGVQVFVVPGVAFDEQGNRLGFGLSYYDRLLAHAAPDAFVIGLAFREQLADAIPTENHDKPVDLVVTD